MTDYMADPNSLTINPAGRATPLPSRTPSKRPRHHIRYTIQYSEGTARIQQPILLCFSLSRACTSARLTRRPRTPGLHHRAVPCMAPRKLSRGKSAGLSSRLRETTTHRSLKRAVLSTPGICAGTDGICSFVVFGGPYKSGGLCACLSLALILLLVTGD